MKTLYLIRHAKSSWNDAGLTDFERPLNERGKRDVISIGERLKLKKALPSIIISSTAKRTRITSKKLAKKVGFNSSEIEFKQELYLANTPILLNILNNISDEHSIVFVVGHNPGISNFCDYLTNQFYDFPTCGIAKITFNIDSWAEVSNGLGDIEWFDYPKNHQG